MSELNNQSLVRNGVTKVLESFKIVKGKRKDVEYLAPKVDFSSPEAWEQEVKWGSLATIASCWQTFLKRVFQDIWFGNVGDDGVVNIAKFLKEAEDFTSAGMKLKEIRDKMEEAQATLGLRIQKAGAADFGNPEWQHATTEINEYILVLKAMADARSRKKADAEEEAEPAVSVN